MSISNLEERLAYPPTKVHRGLLNGIGENNCFLNVTIQALWHLGPFRTELKIFIADHQASIKAGNHDDSLLDAICNIFIQYEFTDQTVLPPNELRESLGKLSDKYELGKIADANEAFDTILHRIHLEQSATCPHVRKCLAHKVFGGLVMEQTICSTCRDTSEPTLRDDFIMCFQGLELINEAKFLFNSRVNSPATLNRGVNSPGVEADKPGRFSRMFHRNAHDRVKQEHKPTSNMDDIDLSVNQFQNHDFGKLLHKCMEVNIRSCPSNDDANNTVQCRGQGKVCFFSLEPPLALALSVGWSAPDEDARTLGNFYSIISNTINLSDLFNTDSVSISGVNTGPSYTFRGLVCYYGLHYVSIFQEISPPGSQEIRFLLFDDQKIRLIGDWEAVKIECIKSKYQPVLLLYELDKASSYIIQDDVHYTETIDDDHDSNISTLVEMYTSSIDREIEQPLLDMSVHSTADEKHVRSVLAGYSMPTLLPSTAESKLSSDMSKMSISQHNFAAQSKYEGDPVAAVVVSNTSFSDMTTQSHISTPALTHGTTSLHGNNFRRDSKDSGPFTAENKTGSNNTNNRNSSNSMSAMFGDTYIQEQNKLVLPTTADSKDSSSSSYLTPMGSKQATDNSSYSKHASPSYLDNRPLSAANISALNRVRGTTIPVTTSRLQEQQQQSQSAKVDLSQLDTNDMTSFKYRLNNSTTPATISKWSYRSMRYNAALTIAELNGRRTLGMEVKVDLTGHLYVYNLIRAPSGDILPAERCGRIEKNDRILTFNGEPLEGLGNLQTMQSLLQTTTSSRVVLDMESSTKCNLWFGCPVCSIQNIVDEETERKLKSHNRHRLSESGHHKTVNWARFMLKCIVCKSMSIADSSIL